MTSLHPRQNDSARSSSQDLHTKSSLTLFRTPQPYHRRSETLTKGTLSLREAASAPSRSESSESGTEADDERGPFLKGLPAAPLRSHKGLRGSTPAHLTPVPSPLPTPPAFIDSGRDAYFGAPRKAKKRGAPTAKPARTYEEYRAQKRREIVRRCTETSLLCAIGAVTWCSQARSASFAHWFNELTVYAFIPSLLYGLFPLRAACHSYVRGKPLLQALRLGFHIPSRFDPGPLLYPVTLPVMVAISLFSRSSAFLPAAIVCGISSIPSAVTSSPDIPEIGIQIHWLLSILPLHASQWRLRDSFAVPLPLKMDSLKSVTQEDLALLFPIHHSLLTVLGYLTTSSLDVSELHLLSVALTNLYIFARSPQFEILKGMVWLGGLSIFISCRHLLIWEVALARVPTWKLLRKRRFRNFFTIIDHNFCSFFIRGKSRRLRQEVFDSEDGGEPILQNSVRSKRPHHIQQNGRAATIPVDDMMTTTEPTLSKTLSLDRSISVRPLRRNTFTAFEMNGKKPRSNAERKPKNSSSSHATGFLSLTIEQAQFRKYAYAGVAYLFVAVTILGPVRLYIGQRALQGHEPFGWALGYLLGNISAFRFWVVSNNLDRWIALPARTDEDQSVSQHMSVQSIRGSLLGPASTRLFLCGYCATVLLCGILAVLRLTSIVEVDTRRKVFHGIMVVMLLPSIFVDPYFIALALSLILAIFLLLDLFRASQLPPISKPLTTFLAPYVDGRDHRGPVIVSHIFLLIGCAIPLWLSLAAAPRSGDPPWTGWETSLRDLSMVSGVVCVGMGDSAASLIGRRYGKTKWYWAGGKSLEGSAAFVLAVTCGLLASWAWLRLGGWVTWQALDRRLVGITLGKCLLAGAGASLLESTLTAANDNVVVPVGLWLLVRGLNI